VLRAGDPLHGHEPRIASDNFAFLRRLAVAGAGIAAIPHPMVERDVARGRLERVLEGWSGEPSALHIVFPSRRDMTARVKAFADHLAEALAGHPSITMDA
jgi:DNA-binding transcriptional LysR family regulator